MDMETEHKSPDSPLRSRSRSSDKSVNQAGGDSGLSDTQRAAAQPPLPWFTESYFSKEPATAAARKVYILILASGGVILIFVMLSVLSIFWGALWKTPQYVHNLNGWVVVSPLKPWLVSARFMRNVNHDASIFGCCGL
jgi:hypothetical protein